MTDTKTPSPSDAELWDLIPDAWTMHVETAPGTKAVVLCNVEDFARAVLARWGQPQAVAGEQPSGLSAALLSELRGYLTAAADGSMSRNNSEAMASELLKQMDKELCSAPPPQAVREPTIQWPKTRDVGRIGDMSPGDFMRVGLDSDNDAYVSVCGGDGMGSVEFCQPGAGGGKSSRTRVALIALMVAMEQDNAEDPGRDWWARRIGGITKGGQHGAE